MQIGAIISDSQGYLIYINEKYGQRLEQTSHGRIEIDKSAFEHLTNYGWPGNVRELTDVLERILSSIQGNRIRASHLPLYVRQDGNRRLPDSTSLRKSLQTIERQAIEEALEKTGYNKSQAAEFLGIHRSLLYKKMNKLGIFGGHKKP
jgi:transcriptional regulator with PAS, ATPase and Fis domain